MADASFTQTLEAKWVPVPVRPLPVRAGMWLLTFARKKPLGTLGLVLIVILIFAAIFAPWLAPYPPDALDLRHRLEGPSTLHRLGTDATGKDVLSRLIYGARVSMVVGFGAVAILTIGGAALGIISAYLGGWADTIIQRIVDAWQAMPGLIILIVFLGFARRMPNVNMVVAMLLAIGVLGIAGLSRVIRSAALSVAEMPYIEAARSLGAGGPRILLTYIFPNVFPLILVIATTLLGSTILIEASLSFLGFGPTGAPSWGQMLSVDGREYMRVQPGLAVWPGVCIGLAVFGFNMFGDALRDVLDPRERGR
jgi:peptide/nickel transport system permease protein